MTKRALLLGGTGAMGVYLVPELLALGFEVEVTTRSARASRNRNLTYIQGDAHNEDFVRTVVSGDGSGYDVIVDFMVYSTEEFRERYELLLKNCKQYIFLSTYRVFADSKVVTEKSPRLLDVLDDAEYLKTDDYALTKARQEDILRSSGYKNWTIIRPAITYSRERFQLGVVEADVVVFRTLQGLPVILPREMLDRTTTMTWGGDVARLIAKLALNKKAFGEDFNVATAEHHTWAEVAEIYRRIIGLRLQPVSLNEYIAAMGGGPAKYPVYYDRMYNRVLDNAKILRATGESQKNFVSLEEGLSRELAEFVKSPKYTWMDYARQARIDRLTHTKIDIGALTADEKLTYQQARYPRLAGIRQTLRPRTRILNAARQIKHTTRLRTRVRSLTRAIKDHIIK